MKKLVAWGTALSTFVLSFSAHGREAIWVVQENAVVAQFESELFRVSGAESFNHAYPFSESYLRDKLLLKSIYNSGLELFHLAQFEMAHSEFQKIVAARFNQDWDLEARQIVANSFLRLGEIEDNLEKRRPLFAQAASFAESSEIRWADFSPRTRDFFSQLKKSPTFSKYRPRKSHLVFDYILINGRKVLLNAQTETTWAPGIQRVTFLSNKFLPVTKMVDLKNLYDWNPEATYFSSGCRKRTVDFFGVELKVYQGSICGKEAQVVASYEGSSLTPTPEFAKSFTKEKTSEGVLTGWLIFGGVALGAILLSQRAKQKGRETTETIVPTNSEGN